MSYEATYKACGIPDEIMDGSFPKNMTLPEQKSSENEEKKSLVKYRMQFLMECIPIFKWMKEAKVDFDFLY